ncbi:MAG: microviridin/marinostatin family tricyclic proteinase inhibitor [Nostoc sp. ZfuVER08]|jgi:bacteriocin-like protein|uniref:Microviridin/marinostatin family tricyclic proteinase inhibitor n=1 Tax=Nostoc punctiforme FACHB-252 TaxID=1357509 RepID=A0ABR8H8U8_NOSPU|nr:microviridin/marinostatin family tricyclic proteinase inhibitor [Nostoc punctiforme]MBD2612024.1 microviridin/marinostatin family tricyclic proteinase inhibitor [Nostoc punctiforme FACHB-252]MBL1202232.1 microviridin/marinostatin family tricyclic proteinase inhibitor [Nostoc sp. GBBB01]MDZ8010538.1 microviridin/marinostatin family tricyclic proteinase inhibitor [Nostoc sp. ZfuVER08]
MSENQPKQANSQAVPFFARFLEGQSFEELSDEELEGISGGISGITRKKNDEIAQTLKYPSDQEDSPISTKKAPSDTDEYAVTQKYPSDGDDYNFPIE